MKAILAKMICMLTSPKMFIYCVRTLYYCHCTILIVLYVLSVLHAFCRGDKKKIFQYGLLVPLLSVRRNN